MLHLLKIIQPDSSPASLQAESSFPHVEAIWPVAAMGPNNFFRSPKCGAACDAGNQG